MPISLVLTWFETRLEDEKVAIQAMTSDLISNNTGLAEGSITSLPEDAEVAYAH